MTEARYYKDYKHNYLILKCEDAAAAESYGGRMLVSGRIDGILKCSVRHMNGDAYFYYDISSRVSFENLYRNKKMSSGQVRDLFGQLCGICRTLGRFFMEETALSLRPDSIYYDFTTRRYFGLYYPGKKQDGEKPYEPLMDFLLNHIDMGDQRLTDLMYRIYEMSSEHYFSLEDTLALWEEEEGADAAAGSVIEAPVDTGAADAGRGYAGTGSAERGSTGMPGLLPVPEDDCGLYERDFMEENAGDGTMPSPAKGNGIFYGVFALISLGGAGAALWIYFRFLLTEQEEMLLLCCLAVMGLCFVFSVVQVLRSGKKERKKEAEDRDRLWEIENEFREEPPAVIENVLDRGMSRTVEESLAERGRRIAAGRPEPGAEEPMMRCGETVFIDMRKQKAEYKLYSLDKKNKKHINLTQFPFSIGKMPGCVDCVLSDASISRLHARIEKQGEKVFLTDMNSTNGTYKNGLRMEPSGTVEIEPGDEIRFGKLNYCYR